MVEFSLSGTNDSVSKALEQLSAYINSECKTVYNGKTMMCDKDSLLVSGKPYISEKVILDNIKYILYTSSFVKH